MIKPWKAIAAMSLNRVIGCDNKIPWKIPEDFKWVRQNTIGQVIVMGRRTFESIGRPLPGRENIVISGTLEEIPGITVFRSLDELEYFETEKEVWLFGGAEIYRQGLSRCSDLYLTIVQREVEGDAFFPEFEHLFRLKNLVRKEPEFIITHYINSSLSAETKK